MALLPMILLRDFTPPNELRYLSIADEALRNHTWFAFSNHGVPYADKPPLYFWIIMLCRWLAGGHRMWLLALCSLLPAGYIVYTMNRWVGRDMGSEERTLAQTMLLTCGLFIGMAVTLRMDMLMTLFIILALHQFWKMTNEGSRWERRDWLFPLYLFLALFTKGALGVLIPLCATTVFLVACRRTSEFFRYWGWRTWLVLAGCCLLWFGAVYMEGGESYLHDMLFRQTAGRAFHSFHHAKPFYFYAISIWYTLAPWSLLVVGGTVAALSLRLVHNDLHRFFLSVSVTSFVLLSCISSKLEVYLLPAIPFLVYTAVMFLPQLRNRVWVRISLTVPALLFALTGPTLLVLRSDIVRALPYADDPSVALAALLLTLTGLYSLYLIYKKETTNVAAVVRWMSRGFLLALFVSGWLLPKLNAYIGYGTLCGTASLLAKQWHTTDIRAWHLPRPKNMDVYLHTPVKVIEDDEVPASEGKPYLLLTRQRYAKHFAPRQVHIVGPYAVVCMSATNDYVTSKTE